MTVVFILSALWWIKIIGLWKIRDGSDWLWGNLGLILMDGTMLSKSLIQFSVDGWGYVPFLFFGLRPNHGRGIGNLLQKDLCQGCCIQCPWPHGRTLSAHPSARDSWTLTGKSGSVSCEVTALLSRVLGHTVFCLCPPRVHSPNLWKFCNQLPLAGSQSLCQISRLGNLFWTLELS